MKEEQTSNRPKTYQLDTFNELHGRGMSIEEICLMYLRAIEDDYHLTIDEIVDYLQCSDRYVRNEVLPYVEHIRINQVARSMLIKYAKEHDEPNELYKKRILFSESSFKLFFLKNTTYSKAYIRYYMADFEFEMMEELIALINEYNVKYEENLTVAEALQDTIDTLKLKNFINHPIKSKFVDLPENLISANDIKEEKGIKHDVIFYNYISKAGLNKVEFGSDKNGDPIFVRYIKKEMNDRFLIKMEVTLYEHLQRLYGDEMKRWLLEETKNKLLKVR